MNGTDGISSLQKMLGSLNVNSAKTAGPGKTGAASSAGSTEALATSKLHGKLDAATLSAAGGLAAQAARSDVRLAKVAQLQQAIASGTYNVPASAVADKMVEGMLNGR